MARKKAQRNERKKSKFQKKHPNMSRTDWAKFKRARKLKTKHKGHTCTLA